MSMAFSASSDQSPAPPDSSLIAQENKDGPATSKEAPAPSEDKSLLADEPSEKTLELAAELFDQGSKAIEDGDFVEAVDCLSRALEIRVAHYGELAPECANAYYKYGYALLFKAQEEADPLGDVPKNTAKNAESTESIISAEESAYLKVSTTDNKKDCASTNNVESGEGSGERDEENNEQSDGEECVDADEDESDLDLSWKMLDVARAIVEKRPEDTIEKVNILAALGEVSMEREDIETSLNDYLKALSILRRLVEVDNRRVIELNFRICLVLEVGSKVQEAIPYCREAIKLCHSRLGRLKEEGMNTDDSLVNVFKAHPESSKSGDQSQGVCHHAEEIKVLSGILSELEKKLEDLQQAVVNPKSIFSEVMKMVASKSTSSSVDFPDRESESLSLNSSQKGVVSGDFDSPTISSAGTNGSVTHLGVVGRGVKRAVVHPIVGESSHKKPSLDLPAEKTDSGNISELVDSSGCSNHESSIN
ncbi:NASP-related protein sim3-like [Dioscorea cayenensis subsp. rotundata]|uniref:NASP-related protein sim3-like n=1 Tax=Dioscorea cayennensis subsp. rotundata TaxID=55577 RepID=A0AB40CEL4_DIOCR|nr:NASP-related protein sim3-like [Dioscorea cayenensis subsp. rotundata]